MTPEELKVRSNKNPDCYFFMCKMFAPTEEPSKGLPEAFKPVELISTLKTPASVMVWIHHTIKAIKAQGVGDILTKDLLA